jgi:F0F1-type ATP synthase gamma subunit
MKTLNDRLMEKAKSEFTNKYYKVIRNTVNNLMSELKITEDKFKRDPTLSVVWRMQYRPESEEVIKNLFPAYAESYIEEFLIKVEEAQSMLEEHTHG